MNVRQLRRVRWAVRACLVLGVAASVSANVLHAQPDPIAKVIAAWPPCALLLTIELMGKVPVSKMPLAVCRLLAAASIAGIAAWVSYGHMAGVALRYGESPSSAYLLPLSVDGLVVVTSVCLVELAGRIADTRGADDNAADPGTPEVTGYAVPKVREDDLDQVSADTSLADPQRGDARRPGEPLNVAPPDTAPEPVPDLPPALVAVAAVDAEQPGLSKTELAAAAGVSPSAVARYRRLNGRTPVLTSGGK